MAPADAQIIFLNRFAGSVAHTDGPLGISENEVGSDRDQRRRNRACQNEHIVVHSQAAKDVTPQPARIDGRGDSGGSDADHRCDSHAGENHSQGEGQLNLEKQLAIGHSHTAAGLANSRVHAVNPGKSVANNRQQRIEHERNDRRPRADTAHYFDVKEIEIERDQKTEQRQARHRLHDVGDPEDGLTQTGPSSEQNSQRHADENGDARGNYYQEKML